MRSFSFFDVDETLLRTKSMFDCLPFVYAVTGARGLNYESMLADIKSMKGKGCSRSKINFHYYNKYSGVKRCDVRKACADWYSYRCQNRSLFFYRSMEDRLAYEKSNGREPVLVSGSAVDILAVMATDLGIRHVLATELETDDGYYNGSISSPQMLGEGKAFAIRKFLDSKRSKASECSAYGDHSSDMAMLNQVGDAYVVGNDYDLLVKAKEMRWKVINPNTGFIQKVNEIILQ